MRMRNVSTLVVCVFLTMNAWAAESNGPSPDEALSLLKAGNARFLAGKSEHPHGDQARLTETAKGQAPFASILGCSDSRESLDVLFDSGIGDLFTIRVAGNVADTDEIASLEYGAEHLHVPLIVVMGHTSCGAVTAVVKKAELTGQLAGLLDNIEAPAARAVGRYGASASDLVDQTARENVLQSIQDMLTRSAILSELVKKQEVKVVAALYHLDTGSIEWTESVPALSNWVSTGLSGTSPGLEPAPASAGGFSGWLGALALFILSLVFLWLVHRLFTSEGRWLSGVKFKGRLTASFLGLGAVLAAGAGFSILWSDFLPFLGALVAVLAFVPIFSGAHYKAFHLFYLEQRRKWETSQ